MSAVLDELCRVMQQYNGCDYDLFDEGFLSRTVEKRCAAAGDLTADGYLDLLRRDPAEADRFVAALQVSYSEFFRNSLTFSLLAKVVLPNLIHGRRPPSQSELRFWSAGCAAGQEAYSLAILLQELEGVWGKIPVRIFATDRHEGELSTARRGVYDASAVQNVPLKFVEKYFSKSSDQYVLHAEIREQVDFSLYDILDPATSCPPSSIFGDFDLVQCCNLMLYYRADVRRHIVQKIHQGIRPGGYLVVGETERAIVEETGGFSSAFSPSPIFVKR